ncbi:MAG TPA: hypothetical protein VFE62_06695 [Gemmataceae bacterium]|nr:hypothetical protein [Gemmataceae bacterium]
MCLGLLLINLPVTAGENPLKVAFFQADVTAPIGTPLCDGLVVPAKEIVDPLAARGVILFTNEKPIVLVALDWVGIGNSGHTAFRDAIARAAGTTRERVCVHCLHQHDAPGCDFEADELLAKHGLGGKLFDPVFARKAMDRIAKAVEKAVKTPETVTHIGVGRAKVVDVASNRRVLGPDGKVKYVRYSASKDPKIRAEPEGVIDPYVHTIVFYDRERPISILTYYATHPQSYYGKGGVSCDFPGLARNRCERDVAWPRHVHFNGASGNVTAGKYNDGSVENRAILADRLAKGMKDAFASVTREPIDASKASWRVVSAALPVSKMYNSKTELAKVADAKLRELDRMRAARAYVWARRCEAKEKIDMQCLQLGSAYVLHMPGELFIEYQLAAQKMRPNSSVMMAAYGDYGAGYIGTSIAYTQGGYETGPVSRVAPEIEPILMQAMQKLLK